MQEIIVYRNPLEAAIWGSLMNGGAVFPVFCACLGFLFVFLVSHAILSKIWKSWSAGQRNAIISGILGVSAAFAILYKMV